MTRSPERVPPAPIRLRVDARDASAERADRHILVAVSERPRLSWTVPLAHDGQEQIAFELRLDDKVFTGSGADPWMILPMSVESNAVYNWSVRVLNELGAWSLWSDRAQFETGPFVFGDWSSDWISVLPLSTIVRDFSLGGGLTRARLHLTGQGLVRATVNGTAVNADSSDPSRTDIVRALYRTYDVTDLLLAGSNSLALTAAHGEWARTGLDPRMLAEIVVTLADGSQLVAGTGEGMSARSSEVERELPFYLERHDATAVGGPVATPRRLDAKAKPSSPAEPPSAVGPDPSPPICVVSTHAGGESSVVDGDRVFALSTNIAGRSRIVLESPVPRGALIRVIHGEHLGDDGRVDTTNLTMPFDHGRERQVVEYVATGEPGQILEPWFCYHGFAFVQVSGVPAGALISVEARALHSDLQVVSHFETNDPVVDRVVTVARRTLLNNVHGIPEDCPTREQSGWTGDTASVADFEFSSFDMESFFAKWLGDLRTSQRPDGSIPGIAPDIREGEVPSDPVWGAAVQRVLLGHWLTYGDARVVAENIGMLRAWADFQLSCIDDDGVIGRAPISYGHDWLALDQTPPRVLQTGATMDSLAALAELERDVGDRDAAAQRNIQLEELRAAAIRTFVDPERHSVGNGSQASLATAIWAGWLDGDDRAVALDRVENDVRSRGNRLSAGFAATRTAVRALAEHGRSQVVFDMLKQPEEPGIGAMLHHGPGTMWENWWIDPLNTGTGSLDHIGLGGPFAGWAEQFLAGIRSTGPGFSTFDFAPRFVRGVDALDYRIDTVRGSIIAGYTRVGTTVELSLTVPVGSEARVTLPDVSAAAGAGTHAFTVEWFTGHAEDVVENAPWVAPSQMSRSSDVMEQSHWLERGSLSVVGGSIEEIHEGLRCMPVPHAQVQGPVLCLEGRAPVLRFAFDEPLDLRSDRFAYAELDACTGNTAEPQQMRITLDSSDGTSVVGVGHFWPAGWNRVAVDIDEWPGRDSVTAIEVTLDFATTTEPVTFTLGGVGSSPFTRTW